MSTLARTRLRIAADAATFDAPLDTLRRATPQFWRGNDVQFEIAAFFNGALLDVSNLASLTLEIRPLGANGNPPDPSFTPLMGATISSFDNTTTLDDWNAGTKQHAVVAFSAAASNITAGAAWLSIFAVTNDSPGRVITLCAGPVRVLEDGAGLATTPTPAGDTFYTAAQSDARFAPIGSGGEGGGGSGSVTSVAMTLPGFLSVSGSPITSSGTLAVSLATQSANTVFAGPASGSAAAPGFRNLAAADLPSALAANTALASSPGGSDNSTSIATTAWVRAYTAGITNDGSGHYIFGNDGGAGPLQVQQNNDSLADATLSVYGLLAASGVGTHMFVNTSSTNDDVLGIQHTGTSGQSAIDFWSSPAATSVAANAIFGAFGFDNTTSGVPSNGRMYWSMSPAFVAPTFTTPTSGVGQGVIQQEGVIGGAYKWTYALAFNSDWSITSKDYIRQRVLPAQPPGQQWLHGRRLDPKRRFQPLVDQFPPRRHAPRRDGL